MLSLTIRLVGRSIHLVRDAQQCETCRNRARHMRVEPGLVLASEINTAVQWNALNLADFRELAAYYGLLHDVHQVGDSQILQHVSWLLETGRLIAVECVPEIEMGTVLAPRAKPSGERPRGVPVPLEDIKTWIEIALRTDTGEPVPNQRYRVKVPGGRIEEGTLDKKGVARIMNLDPGTCEISFPDIDRREVKPA